MIYFNLDARDTFPKSNSCGECCCLDAYSAPGETNKWTLDYAAWVSGIGGKGLVQPLRINIHKLNNDDVGDFPPTSINEFVNTPYQTVYSGNVVANDPESQPLVFSVPYDQGVKNGTLAFNSDGSYTYTPMNNFFGYDWFVVNVSDGTNITRKTVTIGVNPAVGAPVAPKLQQLPSIVSINNSNISIKKDQIVFPLKVLSDAIIGDIFRMDVLATAIDCDGIEYTHKSCFDIRVIKC
jgi:VCBS repeat-containing protein